MEFFDEYNKSALMLVHKFKDQLRGRLPNQLSQKCIPNKLVLVVGMNPSFNAKWIAEEITKFEKMNTSEEDVRNLFSLDENDRDKRLEKIRAFEVRAFGKHPYFDRVRDLSKDCGFEGNWNHIDLFMMRETSQKEALKSVGYKETKDEECNKIQPLNDFGRYQINLFKDAIKELKPKVIIVANTAAAVIFSHEFNLGKINTSFMLDSDFDCHPRVILSGMLGGQRAIDRFSRLRLIREIKEHISVVLRDA